MSTKYKVMMHYPDGESEELDEFFILNRNPMKKAVYVQLLSCRYGSSLYFSSNIRSFGYRYRSG